MEHPEAKCHVLIADDTVEMAARLSELLSEIPSVEVIGAAHSGLKALELFHAHEPDGLVLDMNMPGASGLDVLREVRATRRPCWVILLSNNTEHSIAEACLAAGADHFLNKTREMDGLSSIVANLAATG